MVNLIGDCSKIVLAAMRFLSLLIDASAGMDGLLIFLRIFSLPGSRESTTVKYREATARLVIFGAALATTLFAFSRR